VEPIRNLPQISQIGADEDELLEGIFCGIGCCLICVHLRNLRLN